MFQTKFNDIRPQAKHSYKITLAGTPATGKTCFLAGLAHLGLNPIHGSGFQLFPCDARTKTYLNDLKTTLENGSWIPATGISTLLDFIWFDTKTGSELQILTPDYPGEDFQKAFKKLDPEMRELFSRHLFDSEVILLFLDANEIFHAKTPEQKRNISEKLHTHLTAMREVRENSKSSFHHFFSLPHKKVDIAILLSKSDTIMELRAASSESDHGSAVAEKFVLEHLGNFVENFKNLFKIRKVRFFPVSAVGAADEKTNRFDGGNLHPYGYDAVFQWVARRPKRIFRWRSLLCGTVLVILALLLSGIYGAKKSHDTFREDVVMDFLDDPNVTLLEKLAQSEASTFSDSKNVRQKQTELLNDRLDEIDRRMENAGQQTLVEIRNELSEIEKTEAAGAEDRLKRTKDAIDKKLYEIDFHLVRDSFDRRSQEFRNQANEFLRNHATKPYSDDVRKMIDQFDRDHMTQSRRGINQAGDANRAQIQRKCERINAYVEEYRTKITPLEIKRMNLATDLAKTFLGRKKYHLKLKQFGGFAYPEDIVLEIKIKNQTITVPSNGKVLEVNSDNYYDFQWKIDDPVEVQLKAYGGRLFGGLETVASCKSAEMDAIAILQGQTSLNPWKVSWDWSQAKYMSSKGYFVDCEIHEISAEQWKAFREFIKPGDYWKK